MKKYISLFIGSFVACQVQAQQLDLSFKDRKAGEQALCNESFSKESAVVLLEQEQLIIEPVAEGSYFMQRNVHKIVRINDEKGVEIYNKIRIPTSQYSLFGVIKARTILPNGKTIEIKDEDIKEVKEDDGTTYKIFALEGVDKGTEIEYSYEATQVAQLYGGTLMQDQVPTCVNEVEIVAPKSFKFALKGYNNVRILPDSINDKVVSYVARATNLPGLEEEKYATYLPHFAQVQYVLEENKSSAQVGKMFSWDEIAKSVYNNTKRFTTKQLRAVQKLLEDNKEFKALKSNKLKIEFIEDFVKTNYQQQEYIEDPKASELDYTLKNKYTDEPGIINLFVAMFNAFEIPYEVGYTSSKSRVAFDYDFESPANLKECLFYFPGTNQYMAPNATVYRLPFVPTDYYSNAIVFSNSTNPSKVVAQKRIIPDLPANASSHDHEVQVRFNADMDTAIIQYNNYFLGHNAIDILPGLIYLDRDKKEEFTKQVLSITDKQERMENFVLENVDFKSLTQGKKLKVGATIFSGHSIEKAGPKYLFKIGELIGRQSEMYQEKTRQFDIEIPNPHEYTRTIKVNIPEGYKAINLDKLKMTEVAKSSKGEICSFKSTYTLVDNVLTVNIYEVYNDVFTSKSFYDEYIKVINAAADFNKVVIVLSK